MHSIWMTSCKPTWCNVPLNPSRCSHESNSFNRLITTLQPSEETGFSMNSSAPLARQAARLPSVILPVSAAILGADVAPTVAASPEEGRALIERLGCPVCHDIPGHATTIRKEAPDLTWEGDRVRPDWLFAFLKAPGTIRPALTARMPNFRLTDEEALALTEGLPDWQLVLIGPIVKIDPANDLAELLVEAKNPKSALPAATVERKRRRL